MSQEATTGYLHGENMDIDAQAEVTTKPTTLPDVNMDIDVQAGVNTNITMVSDVNMDIVAQVEVATSSNALSDVQPATLVANPTEGLASSSNDQDAESDALSDLDSDFENEEQNFQKWSKDDEKFTAATPDVLLNAEFGKPGPSKFVVSLRHENGPRKGSSKVQYYMERKIRNFNRDSPNDVGRLMTYLAVNFSWNFRPDVEKLKVWRHQHIYRAKIERSSDQRARWTETEAKTLTDIVARHMWQAGDPKELNWPAITADFNGKMRGGRAEHAEPYAETTLSLAKSTPSLIGKRSPQTKIVLESFDYQPRLEGAVRSHASLLPSVIAQTEVVREETKSGNPAIPNFLFRQTTAAECCRVGVKGGIIDLL